jgi:hypothetical protein
VDDAIGAAYSSDNFFDSAPPNHSEIPKVEYFFQAYEKGENNENNEK